MENKNRSLSPLRMIRIAKNLSVKEIADYFKVTPAYIHAIENNEKNFKFQTLKYGLDNLNITLGDYSELQLFKTYLTKLPISEQDKYMYMLIKTLGVVAPPLKEEAEELLQQSLYSKFTKKQGLDNLNITADDYNEFEAFQLYLSELPISKQDKLKYMLIKIIGITVPPLKDEMEMMLQSYLYSQFIKTR